MKIYENLSIESLHNEEWRDIVGWEGLYQVSSLGRVKSLPHQIQTPTCTCFTKEKILKQYWCRGYLRVKLHASQKKRSYFVHRLVLGSFVGIDDKTVNHRDEVKFNNKLENLEYLSIAENIRYGTGVKRSAVKRKISDKVKRTPVNQYTMNGEFVARYNSITEAKEILGYKKENISICCQHKRNHSNGFIWRYDGDEYVTYNKKTNGKAVIQFDLEGNKINEYASMEEAVIATGVHKSCICCCCRGKIKTAGNNIWKYKEDYERSNN